MTRDSIPVALITDVATDVGLATAIRLARRGYRVFGAAITEVLGAEGQLRFEPVQLNTIDSSSANRGLGEVLQKTGGRLDVLINNTEWSILGALEETSPERAVELFQTNFFGAIRITNAVLPYMRRSSFGRIVNVSSAFADLPAPFLGMYAASKAAMDSWSRTLDHEVRAFGIRVSTVQRGLSRTNIGVHLHPAELYLPNYALHRDAIFRMLLAAVHTNTEPEMTSEVIEKALLSASPKQVYRAGAEAATLAFLRRFTPEVLLSSALRRRLHLDVISADF